MDDSDRNILRSLAHEACEAHCPECGACDPGPTCDTCGEPTTERTPDMDPNATLDIVLDTTADPDDRLAAVNDLLDWLARGGFPPRLHGKLDAPSFGGNTAARQWLQRKLAAIGNDIASEVVS